MLKVSMYLFLFVLCSVRYFFSQVICLGWLVRVSWVMVFMVLDSCSIDSGMCVWVSLWVVCRVCCQFGRKMLQKCLFLVSGEICIFIEEMILKCFLEFSISLCRFGFVVDVGKVVILSGLVKVFRVLLVKSCLICLQCSDCWLLEWLVIQLLRVDNFQDCGKCLSVQFSVCNWFFICGLVVLGLKVVIRFLWFRLSRWFMCFSEIVSIGCCEVCGLIWLVMEVLLLQGISCRLWELVRVSNLWICLVVFGQVMVFGQMLKLFLCIVSQFGRFCLWVCSRCLWGLMLQCGLVFRCDVGIFVSVVFRLVFGKCVFCLISFVRNLWVLFGNLIIVFFLFQLF